MESAIIVTYRCNARCEMCHTWKHPSKLAEEFAPEILKSLPGGQTKINITGGEPTLRKDLLEIVDILHPKTSRLEIISNGSFPEKLFSVADKYPDMTFRISLEGMQETSDRIRGLENGYRNGMRSLAGLRERGVKDLGISMTISDLNVQDLVPLYRLAADQGMEFTQCVPHNSHYFHKHDNEITDIPRWEAGVKEFIGVLLRSRRSSLKLRVKDWFRAYLNLGLLLHVTRGARPLACRAATDFFFVDPVGDILPCNGMADKMPLGSLKERTFNEIWDSEQARTVRKHVSNCSRGCWMVGSAVPAMKRNLPRIGFWVLRNKLLLAAGKEPVCK